MRRSIYLDDVERDLIRTALELWEHRLGATVNESAGHGHWYAAQFTRKRIEALKKKLQEPEVQS